MQILVFFVFIVLVGLGILVLGYVLSFLEDRADSGSNGERRIPDASQDAS